jgi:hypothetical protein
MQQMMHPNCAGASAEPMHWSVIVLLVPLGAIQVVMLWMLHAYGRAGSLRRVKALLKR